MTRNYENVAAHCVRTAMLTFREHAAAMRKAADDTHDGALITHNASVALADEFDRYALDAEDLLTALEEGYVQLVELPTNKNGQFCTGTIVNLGDTTRYRVEHDGESCPVHEVTAR